MVNHLTRHSDILSRETREEIMLRLEHWAGLSGSVEEQVAAIADDPEWILLLRWEQGLEPLSREARDLRSLITSLQPCAQHTLSKVRSLIEMIAAKKSGRLPECGCDSKNEAPFSTDGDMELQCLLEEAAAWVEGDWVGSGAYGLLLGDATPEKRWLVASLCKQIKSLTHSGKPDGLPPPFPRVHLPETC